MQVEDFVQELKNIGNVRSTGLHFEAVLRLS